MSPAIIKYFSITIRLYPNDHKPVHVHAFVKGGYGVKVIFDIRNKEIIGVRYEKIDGMKPLTPAMRKNLEKLVFAMQYTMVKDFQDFVIERKELHNTIVITKKL